MKLSRITGGLTAVLLLSAVLTGCSSTTEPDQVGLYYKQGSSDGNQFDHCTEPSKTDDFEWNNDIIYLPTSLRTWNIAGDGGDQTEPITVSSKPQDGQPSGVPVNVWSQTNMVLNTFCDKNGGVVKSFWETIGRRYKADTEDGWKAMMKVTVVPALEKATRNVVRGYLADDLVANKDGVHIKVQEAIAVEFSVELERLSGGKFFCGPVFNRAKPDCPSVQLIVKDIDYNDPGIQAARNEKQKAIEQAAANKARAEGDAAALLAAAQGQVDAANKIAQLYKNPAWVALKKAEIQLQIAQSCGQNPNCRMIMGADGNIIIQP